MLVLPDSLLNSYSSSSKHVHMDISNFLDWEWRITRAEELSELVSRSSPTIAGVSLERENTATARARENTQDVSVDSRSVFIKRYCYIFLE